MKNLYFISGLGVDARVFRDIHVSGAAARHIRWIDPLPREPIGEYARRLTSQIATKKENIAVGVSFGGIIAQEMARFVDFERIVIISSFKNRKEIPLLYRFLGRIGIAKLLPARLFTVYHGLLGYFFGIESPQEAMLLKSIINDTDGNFARWALQRLLTWRGGDARTGDVLHLHGTADRLLPINRIEGAIEVPGGSHFMIVNRSQVINEILERELEPA